MNNDGRFRKIAKSVLLHETVTAHLNMHTYIAEQTSSHVVATTRTNLQRPKRIPQKTERFVHAKCTGNIVFLFRLAMQRLPESTGWVDVYLHYLFILPFLILCLMVVKRVLRLQELVPNVPIPEVSAPTFTHATTVYLPRASSHKTFVFESKSVAFFLFIILIVVLFVMWHWNDIWAVLQYQFSFKHDLMVVLQKILDLIMYYMHKGALLFVYSFVGIFSYQ